MLSKKDKLLVIVAILLLYVGVVLVRGWCK